MVSVGQASKYNRARVLSASAAIGVVLFLGPFQIRGAPNPEGAPLSSSNNVPAADAGPARLRQQVQITVTTNTPGATNAARIQKSFSWRFSWEGWQGLQVDVSQKSAFQDPWAQVRTALAWTNASPVIHLDAVKMSANLGAKLALDAATYITGSQFTGFDDGFQIRRASVYAKGDCLLIMPVSYQIELGYVPNQFSLGETYVTLPNLGFLGQPKFGEFKAPMSLEVLTSSRDITLMELAAPVAALAPGTDAGLQIGQPIFNERMTWRLGFFTQGLGSDYGDASQDFARAIMRLTSLPLYEPNTDGSGAPKLLHLAASANILYSANSTVHYRSRPESYLAPYVVDTGSITSEGALVIGGEAAWVNGPWSIQGEYLHSFVERSGGTLNFEGGYASASWFLTGESRPYDRVNAIFGRVIPKHNFNFGHGGWGAWELGARGSYVNLNSEEIRGGQLAMLMAEVNWYLHPHVKWRFNYGFGNVANHQPEGNINVFQTRIEVDL